MSLPLSKSGARSSPVNIFPGWQQKWCTDLLAYKKAFLPGKVCMLCSTRIKSSFDAAQLMFSASKGMYDYLHYSFYNVKSNKKHFKLPCRESEDLSYQDHHGPAPLMQNTNCIDGLLGGHFWNSPKVKKRGPKILNQRTSPKYLLYGTVQSDHISSIFNTKVSI